MARVALILGESGSGKSRSIKGLDPKQTFLINCSMKDLPFKGANKLYTEIGDDNPKGNMFSTDRISKAAKMLDWVSKKRPDIKNIIVDDNQYFGVFTFVRRSAEKSFDKFTDIAVNMIEFVQLCKSFRSDITIFFLHHIESGTSAMGNEQIEAKTGSKFVKEKVTYEGLFPLVLCCDKEATDSDKVKHFFWTRLANSTVKTPEGMFESQKIPNDLKIVVDKINEYYS